MPLIKSSQEIIALRRAGYKLAEVLHEAKEFCRPGLRLLELDAEITNRIRRTGGTPSFLGYEGFPAASCLSLNQQVVHGIPDDRILKTGDILGIDVGLWLDGLCVDGATTVAIGPVDPAVQLLLSHTQQALAAGIKAVRPYRRVGMISHTIQEVAEQHGYGIVRSLTGHGVGHTVHEPPEVPNFGRPSDGIILKPGMVLAIEPMLTLGKGDVQTQNDGWGVVTADGSLAAHFEHTVVVTGRGVEILTQLR